MKYHEGNIRSCTYLHLFVAYPSHLNAPSTVQTPESVLTQKVAPVTGQRVFHGGRWGDHRQEDQEQHGLVTANKENIIQIHDFFRKVWWVITWNSVPTSFCCPYLEILHEEVYVLQGRGQRVPRMRRFWSTPGSLITVYLECLITGGARFGAASFNVCLEIVSMIGVR